MKLIEKLFIGFWCVGTLLFTVGMFTIVPTDLATASSTEYVDDQADWISAKQEKKLNESLKDASYDMRIEMCVLTVEIDSDLTKSQMRRKAKKLFVEKGLSTSSAQLTYFINKDTGIGAWVIISGSSCSRWCGYDTLTQIAKQLKSEWSIQEDGAESPGVNKLIRIIDGSSGAVL